MIYKMDKNVHYNGNFKYVKKQVSSLKNKLKNFKNN